MIVAGFGFRSAVTVEALQEAYRKAKGPWDADMLATAHGKQANMSLRKFARQLGVPIAHVPKSALVMQATETQSKTSKDTYGTGSVAEASALAQAGQDAKLLAPRVISSDRTATCALAEGDGL